MSEASGARLPALFFVHGGSGAAGRSLALCSVHLAFGVGGKSETRERQLDNLASLMPGAGYDPSRCVYALMGDFNSNASVKEWGHDLASSDVGERVLAKVNQASPGHTIALKEGKKTSVKGERYDEIIVHLAAVGRRKAHVYPTRETILRMRTAAVPEVEQEGASKLSMAFNNIFSDHLPIFVDVVFKQPAPAPTPHHLPRRHPCGSSRSLPTTTANQSRQSRLTLTPRST